MNEDIEIYRHSASHILAQAVKELYPEVKLGIGPATESGFYYDFDLGRSADGSVKTFTPEALETIEKRMRQIVAGKFSFIRKEVSVAEARKLFADQPYKLELIEELAPTAPVISTYQHDSFLDLCRGPHLEHSGQIPPDAFKLLSLAGAYWRGSERNPMLQRIYGTVFKTAEELGAYLKKLEDLEARDHRRLNKQLNLYLAPEEIGGGLIIYGPKAGRIRAIIEEFWRQEHFANGYELLYTPHIGFWKLWETSGHLDFYREGMYSPIDIEGQQYYLKPMNCPFHMLVYKSRVRSYRDLPMRWAEIGTVYRYERSGVLHGLLRTRGFTQDDAHIICRPEQIEAEIAEVLRFSLKMWQAFGFREYKIYLATRPEKSIGTPEQWERATEALRKVIEGQGLDYQIDKGEGVFYGPKIDLKIKDALDREWQNTTIQFDFNLPERFDLVYTGKDGLPHRPYMVHRALLGSWERFFGLLIEHYAGAFPLWIAPVQVKVLTISEKYNNYAADLARALAGEGIRYELDLGSEKLGYKIRQGRLERIPYLIIIGEKEVGEGTISLRSREKGDEGKTTLPDLVKRIKEEVRLKK